MKIKRLFAALLTALMVVSCFSFTANAQETQTATAPVVSQTAKASNATFRNGAGLAKTKLYDAANDKIFYRFNPVVGSSAGTHLDAWGLPKVTVTDGKIYLAYEMRSNYSVTPSITVYSSKDTSGGTTTNNSVYTATATAGNGNWERVVIEISNEKLASFEQNHMYIFGRDYSPATKAPVDAYVDISAFGYFNDEYSALNYDFGTLTAPNGAARFSVDGTVSETVPEADPVPESGYFMGWSADDDATRGDAVTALSTVPDADTTYYAIFSGEIEDEKAVYISANGSDANSGRHSKAAVGSFAKANTLLAGEIDTLYVVGAFTLPDTITLGVAGDTDKVIKVYGYNGTTDSIIVGSKHVKFAGNVVIDNISLSRTSNDGGYQLLGNNVTIGDNVLTSGDYNFISQGYYGSNITDADGSVLNVNSGTWQRIATTNFTDKSYTGNATHNIGGTAVVGRVFGGHGNGGSNQIFNGTYTLNVDDSAKVTTIDFTHTGGGNPLNTHNGAILINVNGGTVENIKTTSSSNLDTNADVTVVAVNGGTVGAIAKNLDDDNTRVVIFNNEVEAIDVADDKAIVIDVTGADLHADVTVASDYTATLNGFKYETEFNYYDTVKIGDKEIALADLENGIIPASEFAAGVNTVEFFEAEKEPITAVYISAKGDDANDGATAETAVATLARAYEIANDENNAVEEIIIVGAVSYEFPSTAVDVRNLGIDGKTITFKGIADGETAPKLSFTNPDGAAAGRIYLKGDLTFENITFDSNNTGEVPYATLTAKSITINNGVKFLKGGNKTGLVGTDYADPNPTAVDNTITINGKDFEASMINIGAGYGGGTKTGKLKLVMNGGNIPYVRLNKGSTGDKSINSTFKGTVEFEINDGTIGTELGFQQGANFNGLGYMTINGGTIKTLYTTGVNHSWAAWNDVIPFPLDNLKGVMVYEINGGTVTEIKRQADTANVLAKYNSYLAGLEEPTSIEAFPDAWTAVTRVVIFNDGVEAVDVQDTDAYVLDVTGAKIEADATVAADYTATLNKFTYDVTDTTFDQVVITAGETTNTYKLADLNGEIALDKLTKGVVNEITFSKYVEAPKTADYTIKTYTMGTDGAYGEAVTETKTAEVGTTATFEPAEKTGFTISTGSTLSGTVTADGLLTLAVYYDRNQYKLYTKADAEAEAVEAGTYYYEAALTAPATPEKDGYTFKGWDPTVPANMPANDVTLTATWEKNAPTTATLKFYDGDTLFVEKTVAIGATVDILPLMSDADNDDTTTHANKANDILARPSKKGYKLVGWSLTNGGDAVEVTANADASYYAVWEEVPVLTAGEDFTLTIVDGTTVTASPVPADAISFIRGDEKNSFATNSNGVKYYDTAVTDLSAYGVSYVAGKTGIGSWYGGADAQKTVLCPEGTKSIWYKWNDSYISAKPGLEGEYNVAYWIYTGSEGSTRAFTLDAPGKNGVVYLEGAGTKDHFVQFKATLTADSELKYSAALDFDDSTIKGAQLLGIYVWQDAPVITKANATFDANGGAWADGETTKAVETTIGETPVAPEAPAKKNYTFAGWEPALAAMVAEGATYKAKWTATPRTFGDNVVYVSNAGDDANDGSTPEKAVKTLTAAAALLAADKDNLDTIVVVGTYEKKYEAGASVENFGAAYGKKITITGYDADAVFDMRYYNTSNSLVDSHLRIATDVEINNIKLYGSSKDGGLMSQGYELTFGDNITLVGGSQNIGFLHYNAQKKDFGVVNVLSGSYNKVDIGVQSGQTYRGTSTINISGTASTKITNGHGWQGTQAVYGITNVNIKGGNVSSINLSATADTAVTNYAGLRYFTINGGTVGNISTTGSSVSKVYDAKIDKTDENGNKIYGEDGKPVQETVKRSQTASARAGVTVFEINGGTVGTIALGTNKQTGEADPDDATRVVILNNGMTTTVTDTGAIVVKATGAKLHAATNAQETYPEDYTTISADWGKAVALKGFTYELPKDSTANAVKVDGGEAVLLADLTDGLITGITTAGEHTVEFVYVAPVVVNNKVYLSDNGDDANDGLTAETPVKNMAKANELLAAEGKDTLVIVDAYSICKDKPESYGQTEVIGIENKTITIEGNTADAVFCMDRAYTPYDDAKTNLAGPVIIKNLTLQGENNDGYLLTNGYDLVIESSVTAGTKSSRIVPGADTTNNVVLKGGTYKFNVGGTGNSVRANNTTLTVDGAKMTFIGLGKGNYGTSGHNGRFDVVINSGEVTNISIDSDGTGAANAYKGVRYFVLNGGKVYGITTTGSASRLNNSTEKAEVAVADRTGVTVFEINAAGVLDGNINLAKNKIDTTKYDVDDAKRIIIFNNGSYASYTGTNNDTTAITVNVIGGALKADVTMADDYTATLKGYTFTTDKKYVTINGTKYNASEFVTEAALAGEEVSGVIPADKLTAGVNTVLFTDVEVVDIKWVVNGVETTESYEVGQTVTAPAAVKAPTKTAYYTLKAWNDGTADIADIAAYTVPAGGATLTAVFEEHAMPASASIQYSAFSQVNNVAGVFTHAVETIDGVEAVKITPASDSETAINLEGSGKYPENYSTGTKSNVLDPAIYDYAVYRYYYVPGTNTEDRTFYIWYQKHPWEDTTLVAPDAGSFTMEAGKWTYIVDKLDRADGTEPDLSIQYHLRPMNNVAAKDLAANGEYIYVDSMQIFSAEPTVATVTFKGDDGEVLYAIDALNSEAVTYNGAKVEKDGFTFKGWAIEGTTAVVDALTFAQDTVLVPVFEENAPATIKVEWVVDGTAVKTDDVEAGTAVTAPADPEKDGFRFVGWAIEGTDTIVETFAFEEDTTLVPVFVELVTIEWIVDGKTYVGPETVDKGAEVIPPYSPTKDGYTFKGWAVEGTTEIVTNFVVTGDTKFVAVFEGNAPATIKVEWIVDGTAVKTDDVEAGTAATAPADPEKDGFTFKGWAVEGTTDVITDFTFTTDTKLVAVFEENSVVPAETATYKTYGVYDAVAGTYTIELKVSGAQLHMGSFGFELPGLARVTANAAIPVSLFAEEATAGAIVSPIFAKGEDFYANTWAIEAAPGYIDATAEEILLVTFVLNVDKTTADAIAENGLTEYVIENADAKYHNGTNYLGAPKVDSLDTEKIAIVYEGHEDNTPAEPEKEFGYKTYGTYDPSKGTYTIDVKFIGGKINAGAFGLAFDSDYMTFDPAVDAETGLPVNIELAEGVASYLGLYPVLTAEGVAFVWDGSADAAGYVDATDAEVLVATITTKMTADQRAAFEADKTMAIVAIDDTVEDADKFFDGTDYLVTLYDADLAVARVKAPYLAHADEALEITTADVAVKVTFAGKEGKTVSNIGYIIVGNEQIVIDDAGNENATVEYTFKDAKVGELLEFSVVKNGYIGADVDVKVSAAGNEVEVTLVPGDIKESTDAISGNGEVELSDFIRVVRAFDDTATKDYKATVDINEDGATNVTDLAVIKSNFGKTITDSVVIIDGEQVVRG